LSSLLDVPVQLALVLSVAATTAGHGAMRPPGAAQATVPPAQSAFVGEPLKGPYRFSERMWLRALKEDVADDGRGYSARIFQTSGGRYYVPASAERHQILKARWDAELAGRVARAAAMRNARALAAALQRAPTAGDLYIAHVFGPEAAIGLIKLAAAKPDAEAASYLPELARAEPALFEPRGAPLTLAQAYEHLTGPLRAFEPHAGALAARYAPERPPAPSLKPTTVESTARVAAMRVFVPEEFAWRPEVSASNGGALHQ